MLKCITLNVLLCSRHSCTLCVCLSINVWSVHQQLLLSTLTLCYSVLSCVSWAGLAVGAFRSAPKSPALVGISWGKKDSQTLGLSALAHTPSQFSPNLSQASSHSFDVGHLVPFTFPGTDPTHSWGLHTRLHPLQLFTIWLISDTDPGTQIGCFQLERTE